MSPLLLLFLLFITASGSSFLPHRAIPTGLEDPQADLIARTFVSDFNAAVSTGNENQIAEKFSEDFTFFGCSGAYNKKESVSAVVDSKDGPVVMTFESAKVANGYVYYNATVFGIKDLYKAEFVLQIENGTYVLVGGLCISSGVLHESEQDIIIKNAFLPNSVTTKSIAKVFIGKLNRAIASRNRTQVAALFDDSFQYFACFKQYKKPHFIDLLLSDATLTQTIFYKSSRRGLRSIFINIGVFGFGSAPFEATLSIANKNGVFVGLSGRTKSCPRVPVPVLPPSNQKKKIVTDFLSSLKESIDGGNVVKFQNHFSDNLKLIGCNGNINKKMLISGFPAITKPEFVEFILLDTEPNHPFLIFFHAQINGLGPAIKGQFVLDEQHGRYVLYGGIETNCNDQ